MISVSRSLTVGFQRASKLRTLVGVPQYRRALRHRVAASVEHERTPLGHDYRTILDIGANRGQFALVAARRFPNASLVCVEPQPGPRETLGLVMVDHPRLRLIDAALAATVGPSVLHITQADDSSSLLPTTKLQVDIFPGAKVIDQVRVTTQRLDALVLPADLERPTLLKIDVQGTELEVLTGASGLLTDVDTILVECSFVELYGGQALAGDVLRFLHLHGFRLANVVAPTLDGDRRLLQADLVFERASAAT